MEGLVSLLLAVPVGLVAVQRTRAEPRRLSNGFWLLAALVLALNSVVALGVPGGGLVLLVVGGVLVLSPLLVLALIVLLVLNGLAMVRREGRSLGNLLSLLAGLALLGLAVTPVVVVLTGADPVVLAVVMAVLLAAGYLGFVLAAFLGYSWLYRRLVARYPASWVVVLGSGLGGGERVTPLLAGRIRAGLDQVRTRRAPVLVMSGGRGSDESVAEGRAMADWALEQGGLDPGREGVRLLVEDRSRTTEENLSLTAALLRGSPELTSGAPRDEGPQTPTASALPPGLVVNSSYHVMRAAMLARRLGVPAQAAGAPPPATSGPARCCASTSRCWPSDPCCTPGSRSPWPCRCRSWCCSSGPERGAACDRIGGHPGPTRSTMSQPPRPLPTADAPAADPGRVLGIVGLVTAFTCFGVVGLVVSVVAWRRSRRAGFANTVALLGIVAGAVLTLCWLVVGGFTLFTSLLLDEAMTNGCEVLGPGTHELDDVRYDCP